ncbi:protein GVQW3-like [Belonocnema kinseyi]|uniref:protein GVQW3-like n=1 Tax=Belonocnema kinseyi TaxID=2817044 RepID=UPI00143CD396|nr:protein GVQW3-like [Belonocnema kinseyi]
MAKCREQRAAVKFGFLLGKSAAETIVMLKTAYGDAALCKSRVYEWFSSFENGEMSIEDQLRSGVLSEDVHMGRVEAKFVPRLLTGEQRERRLQALFEPSPLSS